MSIKFVSQRTQLFSNGSTRSHQILDRLAPHAVHVDMKLDDELGRTFVLSADSNALDKVEM